MRVDRESTEELEKNLRDVLEYIEKEYEEKVQFVYGADDTLVVIESEDMDDNRFIESIGDAVMNATNNPCGVVISDGPDSYSDQTAAYIRYDADNAYEYAIGLCTSLGMTLKETTSIFKTIYENTGGENTDAKSVCGGYVFFLSDGYSVSEIADKLGVTEDAVREKTLEASQILGD